MGRLFKVFVLGFFTLVLCYLVFQLLHRPIELWFEFWTDRVRVSVGSPVLDIVLGSLASLVAILLLGILVLIVQRLKLTPLHLISSFIVKRIRQKGPKFGEVRLTQDGSIGYVSRVFKEGDEEIYRVVLPVPPFMWGRAKDVSRDGFKETGRTLKQLFWSVVTFWLL